MSEGFLHGALVSKIAALIKSELGEDLDVILVDLPGSRPSDKPPKIGSYFPDVWAQSRRRIYVGEAKTALDLETTHTQSQLRSFLKHISLSPSGSSLIIAVPGFAAARARSLMRIIGSDVNGAQSMWRVISVEALST